MTSLQSSAHLSSCSETPVRALQVDLGVPKMVRGVITQGARGLEGSTSAENRAFVRKYKLAHSLSGKDWSYILDSKTGFAKVKTASCPSLTGVSSVLSSCRLIILIFCSFPASDRIRIGFNHLSCFCFSLYSS